MTRSPFVGWSLAVLGLLAVAAPAPGQTTWTWNPGVTSDAWLDPLNWTGPSPPNWPGVTTAANPANGTAGDTAVVGDFAFTPGNGLAIDMAAAGGELSVGALRFTGSTANLTVLNPSTASGLLRLNGATVAGVPNVILANTSGGRELSVMGNLGGTLTQNLGVRLGTPNGVILVNPGRTITVGASISEAAAGSGLTVQRGATDDLRGTVVLSGTNTYSGATTLGDGVVLQAGSASAFGNNSAVTVSAGATLRLNGFSNSIGLLSGSGVVENGGATPASLTVATTGGNATVFGGLVRDGGAGSLALVKSGFGILYLNGVHTYTGGTTVTGGSLTIGELNKFGMIGGDIHLATDVVDVTFNPGTTDNTYAGRITGSGTVSKGGSNTLILTGASTYTGDTDIYAGTVRLAGGPDRLPAATVVSLMGSGVLDLNGTNQTVAGVSGGPSTGTIQLGSGTLTIDYSRPGLLIAHGFHGEITGTGSVVMNRGFQVLSGASTYTGATTINQGTLRVTNATGSATGSGPVTVNAGGTLDGTGRIFSGVSGAVPVRLNGGTVAVGGGAGVNPTRTDVLTLGSGLTFDGSASLRTVVGRSGSTPSAGRVGLVNAAFDRDAGGAVTDVMTIRLVNDGTLSLTGGSTYTVTVLTYGTLGAGLTPFTDEASPAHFAVAASNFGFATAPLVTLNNGALSVTFRPVPVPEPGTVLAAAATGLGLRRLRRRLS